MLRLTQILGQKRIAIAEACLIGLVSGLAAVALKQSVEGLTLWRLHNPIPVWLLLPGLGLVGGAFAGWLGEQCPETAGSGIPQVKAALGYVHSPLNLRVALMKLASTAVALGSGLSLGRQGPTVQIGAALAAQLSDWVPTSPEYRRQLISAGAAAGLAAGFNAPISGVLFVVEELLQDFSGLTLGTAILASFVGAVVSRLLGGQGLNLSGMGLTQTGLSVQDLPFLALLGVLAGVLGSLFSRGIFTSLRLFRRWQRLRLAFRVGLAGGITGLVGVGLSVAAQDNTGLREFLVTGDATWQVIAIAFISKFFLTLLAYGSGASGGIFAPALVLGSALGCLVSFLAQATHGWLGFPTDTLASGNTTTYALTGMGAFFSATTRVPITAIVIVFEMTTNFNLVLPLMIGSGLACLVADRVTTGSLYNGLLAFKGIHLNPAPSENNPWAHLTAADLMQRRVETLTATMSIPEALDAFARSHHRGFPVLTQGKLVGIVTQTDLAEVPQTRTAAYTVADFMTPRPVTVAPEAPLPQVLYLLNRLKVSRLPVTDGSKLVGIITRGDIIRAESEKISGQSSGRMATSTPSYGIYRTRSPALGQGRLLVPLADPDTAPLLLSMAAAIAHQNQYELECVHIVRIPPDLQPSEATVDLKLGKRLLIQAEALAEEQGLCLHTQIRVGHDVARALLEVVNTRHIDLVLMGWRRHPITPGRILGSVVDTLLRQAPCPVMVVRPGETDRYERWLVPMAGGPNAPMALSLLPALVKLAHQPMVCLCSVVLDPAQVETMQPQLQSAATALEARLGFPVKTRILRTTPVAEAIVHLSRQDHSDVVFLGASREGLFSQMLHGNVPLEVSHDSPAMVILLRQNILAEPSGD
ncbi:chloride channel protein [Leptolyngbya sp. PCC 6406]|uniref:chloride channel protein n=1 Tax=Leptolyngbya sp. PCC 6406 TaxID=1173264 RepID=UPI0002AC9C8A|nr:chloride channel protein [Leptolyngbya sp. PCC 6406]